MTPPGATPDLFAPLTDDLFARPGPRWFTVPAHRPFLDDLAAGLWASLARDGPEALADAVVLLPTRRGARDLAAAFVGAAGGRAVLLPQIRALGDLDEGEPPFEPGEAALALPPSVSPLRRRFELARLVVSRQHLLRRTLDARGALELADALAALLDGLELEEVAAPDRLDTLVEGEFARHWQVSADVLGVATREWPARLAELGLMDVAARQVALLRALARQWSDRPPRQPLVAAGATGGAPAAAALLSAIAAAPQGAVVLPGLDKDLADAAWAQVEEAHPQGALKRLLEQAGVARADVAAWPAPETAAQAAQGRARRRVVNEALRPAEATADWRRVIDDLKAQGGGAGANPVAQGLEGLAVLSARSEEAAAAQAAVLLREALETPGRTAALVTPDPALARRCAARLARWGVAVDSSAGAPLADFPAGVLMALLARAAAFPLEPAVLLALAKHPLARLGQPAAVLDLARRGLERRGLRGPRPHGWAALHSRLAEHPEALALAQALQAAIAHAAAPFAATAPGADLVADAPAAMRALAVALERVAVDAEGRLGELWAGPGGEAAAALVAGVLMALLARAAAFPLEPAVLLALAKHPLARLGQPAAVLDLARRGLERRGLRGPRPHGWAALHARLAEHPEALALAQALQAAIAHAAAPFAATAPGADLVADAPAAMRALAEALERVAVDAEGRLGELWAGPGGEAAAALVAGVLDDGAGLPPVTAAAFAQAVETLLAGEVVRTGGALHPRLRILGLIEARLVRADLLVLAGLEEGTWPRAAPTDPFLSRPMRARLGLPPPERRVGQAAHDFAQAACAPQVALIHAERRGGQPAVKSRWLWRLETLAKGAGAALPGREDARRWAARLDAPLGPAPAALKPAPRPAPTPPVEARPRELAVTRVEEWLRDPYATYARYVLRLKPLARPDAPVEAMARGSAVHAAFERFVHDALDPGAEDRFAALLSEALAEAGLPSWRMARERALAANLSRWAVDFERARRPGAQMHVEVKGQLALDLPHAPFAVTAKADRLERRDGRADVLDFKTGATPTQAQVESGFSPQLTLTGAILAAGGFPQLGAVDPGELMYVRVTGRREPGRAEVRGAAGGASLELAQVALEGLHARAARFDDPATPYTSWAAPQFLGRHHSDFDHLARVWEWHVMGAEPGEDGGEGGG